MNSREALAHVVRASGKSKAAISRGVGKSSNFVSALFSMKRAPGTDLLAEIAQECGYTLQLVGHGETLQIDGKADSEPADEDGEVGAR